MNKLEQIEKVNKWECWCDSEFKDWNFMQENNLMFIESNCLWRTNAGFSLETIMKNKKTQEYYKFNEIYNSLENNMFKRQLECVEKVGYIGEEYFSKYLLFIYEAIESETDVVDCFKKQLVRDLCDCTLVEVDDKIVDVDIDNNEYEKEVVIQIADRYFMCHLNISEDGTRLDWIKRVYPKEKTITNYE